MNADEAWEEFVAAAKAYAPHMDQWEKIKFNTDYGTVYITVTRTDPYPDAFDEV